MVIFISIKPKLLANRFVYILINRDITLKTNLKFPFKEYMPIILVFSFYEIKRYVLI